MLMAPQASSPPDEQHALARALCAALAFEGSLFHDEKSRSLESPHVKVHTLAKGRITPKSNEIDLEQEFFDAVEFHDSDPENELHLAFSRSSSSVEMIRGGASTPIPSSCDSSVRASPIMSGQMRSLSGHSAFVVCPPAPRRLESFEAPPPPKETPVRFIRAGKGDPILGRQRYEETLAWRKENGMDTILKEPHPHFDLIKSHYPHYFHARGKRGEYCYYECPPRTNLKALREGGLTMDELLRHYAFVTEFSWQYIDRNDFGQSLYVIDLKGIRVGDFVGECVDFVKRTSQFTAAHYPERCGCVFVINVPSWFKLIWNVVKPWVDVDTLKKIYILRGKTEIFNALSERIPLENIPPEYGGKGVPLGQAPEEQLLRDLVQHNNDLAQGSGTCKGMNGGCQFCTFRYARSY